MDNNLRILNNVVDRNNQPPIIPLPTKHTKDLTGKQFGRLKVLGYVGSHGKNKKSLWLCECQCENKTLKIVLGHHLTEKYKPTRSCGCLIEKKRVETKTKHSMTGTRIYRIYRGMKNRCYNTNEKDYKDYGERGIKICNEWFNKENGFMNFYNWAISSGYTDELSIERKNVNGNYEPNNCTWIPLETQAQNTRKNIRVAYKNKEYSLPQLYTIFKPKITYNALQQRIQNGMDIEKALNLGYDISEKEYDFLTILKEQCNAYKNTININNIIEKSNVNRKMTMIYLRKEKSKNILQKYNLFYEKGEIHKLCIANI